MAINKAVQGAVVQASDLQGLDLNAMVNAGYISPRNGGQAFEFLKPYDSTSGGLAGAPNFSPGSGGTSVGGVDLSRYMGDDISTSTNLEQQIRDNIARQRAAQSSGINAAFDVEKTNEQRQGALREGGTTAQLGVSKGLGLSSAEIGLIRQEQEYTSKRITEIEKARQIALSNMDSQMIDKLNESLRAEQDRADKLSEMRFNRIKDIIGLGFQERGLDINQQQVDIQEKSLLNTIKSTDFNMKISEAGLTGLFDGAETMQAKEQRINQALKEAELTGQYNGQDTLAARQFDASMKEMNLNARLKLLELQTSLPAGFSTKITLPDGTVFTLNGMKKAAATGEGTYKNGLTFSQFMEAQKLAVTMPQGTSFDVVGKDGETTSFTGLKAEEKSAAEQRIQQWDDAQAIFDENLKKGIIVPGKVNWGWLPDDKGSLNGITNTDVYNSIRQYTGLSEGDTKALMNSWAERNKIDALKIK